MPTDPPPPPAGRDGDALKRLQLLAAAGEVLATSLDLAHTLQAVARVPLPELADYCIVDVLEQGRLRCVGTAHVRADRDALVAELRRRYPATPGQPSPASRVLASGRRELVERVSEPDIAAHTVDAAHAALVRAIGVRSHLAVPLVARGAVIGAVSFGITESDRRYEPADVALAEEFARRVATAIDSARLYRQAQDELAQRRRIESELRLSEQRFRAIMEQSPLSMQILGPDGHTRTVNAAWRRLWRAELADLEGYDMLRDPQLDALGILPLLRRAFAGEAVRLPVVPYRPEATLPGRSADGETTRWVSAHAYPVRDEAGAVREIVLVHEDVTDSRVGAERLRASEARLRLALGAARMFAWEWDTVADALLCSDEAAAFWGATSGSGAAFLARVHPDDLAGIEAATAAALASGDAYGPVEFRLAATDGSPRWVQSRGRVERDARGRALRVIGVTLDITDLRRARDRSRVLADAGDVLGASLDYRATLADLAGIMVPAIADWYAVDLLDEGGELERVAVVHRDPRRVALAHELVARFPARREHPLGAWTVVDSGQPQWAAEIDEQTLAGVAQSPEHLAVLRGLGLRSFIRVPLRTREAVIGVLTLVQAESGRRYGEADVELAIELGRRVAVAVDNARLHAQLQLEHRRKDEFLAMLAHELRNPLAPIRTGLAILEMVDDADTAARTRTMMRRQVGHMVRLVDDLLDLSRITRGTIALARRREDLAAIVGSAVDAARPLIAAAGLELSVQLPDHPLLLSADHTRLAQVLSNLLNNAARFTAAGGSVVLRAWQDGDTARIEVRDTGVGIEPELIGAMFEMFVRGSDSEHYAQGGLGIGLTLARRLVELHGGSIHAESAGRGRGSRFVVCLPLSDPSQPGALRPAGAVGDGPELATDGAPREPVDAAPGAVPDSRPRGPAPAGARVLVVDDNLDAAESLRMLLEGVGHAVRTAETARSALDVAAEFRPHVALLDIGLPDLDGHELARRLRAQPALAPLRLIAITGWGRSEDRERSLATGFDHHLTKPVDVDALLELVARP